MYYCPLMKFRRPGTSFEFMKIGKLPKIEESQENQRACSIISKWNNVGEVKRRQPQMSKVHQAPANVWHRHNGKVSFGKTPQNRKVHFANMRTRRLPFTNNYITAAKSQQCWHGVYSQQHVPYLSLNFGHHNPWNPSTLFDFFRKLFCANTAHCRP